MFAPKWAGGPETGPCKMSKREAESPELNWESPDEAVEVEAEAEDASREFNAASAAVRLGFHLEAARKIEQARERRMLREAMEDFDDYVV